MERLIKKAIFTLLTVFLITGCIGNSNSGSSDIEKRPSLNEDNIVSTATNEVKLDENEFSDGIVQEDVEIPVQSEDGKEASKTIIPAGTEFQDESGKKVETTPPTIVTVQKESKEESIKDGRVITKNVVKSELKIIDKDGNKLIPSEPITVTIKAPAGSKPGDEVRVDIPDGAGKATGQQKLTVFIVDSNGNITIVILPTVFEKYDVVVIIIEKKIEAILTGGTGGN